MKGMVARNLNKINPLKNTIRYSLSLILTKGRKVCTELAASIGKKHDSVQRDLNAAAKNPEEIEAKLLANVIQKNRETPGYLIMDNSLLIKEHAKKIEGVSYQHAGSQEKPGISVTALIWTNLKNIEPVTLFTWKKGDKSKIKTATDFAISFAQKINAKGVLADGAFASIDAINKYIQASVSFVMRFHSNRVIEVPGFEGSAQIAKHPAFKFKKNQRSIIRKVLWHGLELRVIALKIKHATKGWIIMFLVTNMSTQSAQQIAELYTHRWKIETFFRTCKQQFGLGQCQAHSLRKQKAHCLSVFLAYSMTQKIPIPLSDHKNHVGSTYLHPDQIKSLMSYA